jgi:hypothetical protein
MASGLALRRRWRRSPTARREKLGGGGNGGQNDRAGGGKGVERNKCRLKTGNTIVFFKNNELRSGFRIFFLEKK